MSPLSTHASASPEAPPSPSPAPLSDFFGGFGPWLDFRSRAALERVRASLASLGADSEPQTLLLRALPLRESPDGSSLWALCDGELPPLPLLIGPRGRWGAAGSSWFNGDPIEDGEGSCDYPDEDGMVELLSRSIQKARALDPSAPFIDALIAIDGPVLSAPFSCAPWSPERWDEGEPGAPAPGAWPETLARAWARLASSPPGEAAKDPAWRELQGERRVALGFGARPLTRLSLYETEPGYEPDCNLWGQCEERETAYWLIEPDGAEPFLLERERWQAPYHQLDEVRRGSSLRAKGQTLWSESYDMDNAFCDPRNLFTLVESLLPVVEPRGFDFIPAERVRVSLPPMFEADARPWLSLIDSHWAPSSESESPQPALLAMLEAALLGAQCQRGGPEPASPAARSGSLRV